MACRCSRRWLLRDPLSQSRPQRSNTDARRPPDAEPLLRHGRRPARRAARRARASRGPSCPIEQLVARHGPWIFNVAARTVWRRDDAADITQEVLVKVSTQLSTFRGASAFRTWLYRIVVNHVINLKKRQPLESAPRPFESFVEDLDEAGDAPPSARPQEGS